MDAKHTPGPWPMQPTGDGKRITIGKGLVEGPNGYEVAEVYSDDCPYEVAEANARLIAAAPDLLAALRKATDELNAIRARDGAPQHIDWHRGNPIQTDACTHEYWDALTEECFAAIDKATERPPTDELGAVASLRARSHKSPHPRTNMSERVTAEQLATLKAKHAAMEAAMGSGLHGYADVMRYQGELARAAPALIAEIERLREAIAWALGESPEGIPEFTPPEGKHPPYWWRKKLRELARPSSLQPPKEGTS